MSIYTDINQFNATDKAVLEDAEAVFQAVWNVYATRRGERLFRPEFGTRFHRILHKLITDGTRLELLREAVESVTGSEPRAELNGADTEIEPDMNNIGVYNTTTAFRIRGLEGQTFRFRGSLSGETP